MTLKLTSALPILDCNPKQLTLQAQTSVFSAAYKSLLPLATTFGTLSQAKLTLQNAICLHV